jgi:hypothetical protein
MNRIIIAVILVLVLWAMLMVSGCATFDAKMNEMKMNNVAQWEPDKPIVLDECPDCFYLGPLQYDEMLIALGEVK